MTIGVNAKEEAKNPKLRDKAINVAKLQQSGARKREIPQKKRLVAKIQNGSTHAMSQMAVKVIVPIIFVIPETKLN